jgi:hypothetical protein
VVWEWHLWDHLVQDFDPGRENYGVVGDHPELLDANYPDWPVDDWIHLNSIDYNAELDQILVSSRVWNEIWVIDHSTTSAEAAGHSGGRGGMGGDLLYRWGNPQAYHMGGPGEQVLFGQHDAQWISGDCPGAGDILVFNNGHGRPSGRFSSVDEIVPPLLPDDSYARTPGAAFGPTAAVWSYRAPVPTDFFSDYISGAQRLPSGNTLICSGADGWFFEVTPGQQMVWEHVNPLPDPSRNQVFKVRRYERYLWASSEEISAADGGLVHFDLLAGSANAGRDYMLGASMSGVEPGTPLPGGLVTIPLNRDLLSDYILAHPDAPYFSGFTGSLDALGRASGLLDTQGALPELLPPGSLVHFAYALSDPWDFASNATPVAVVP